eukprot:TRINITY_DN22692_c0_g1_i2.p1 TRINITY_DN22692_c0_g1~~TRINITY_DN22692_c0_g1_i2.p1  ORF type:complete len:415 (-),score=45.39 TRINITY_DN22692_c0_g1_i2:328-1491(-)
MAHASVATVFPVQQRTTSPVVIRGVVAVPHFLAACSSAQKQVEASSRSRSRQRCPHSKAQRPEPLSRSSLASMPFTHGEPGSHESFRILCYGDSLTAGFFGGGWKFEPYGRSLSDTLTEAGVANEVLVCGHSGCTAEEMVYHMDSSLTDVAGLRGKGLGRILEEDGLPNLALIMAGTNDISRGTSIASIVDAIRELHEECHDRGVDTVMLVPPPAPRGNPQWETKRQMIIRRLQRLARSMPRVVAFLDAGNYLPITCGDVWDPDGLHFSAAGSRLLGERLAGVLFPKLTNVEQNVSLARRFTRTEVRGSSPISATTPIGNIATKVAASPGALVSTAAVAREFRPHASISAIPCPKVALTHVVMTPCVHVWSRPISRFVQPARLVACA